MTYKPQKPTNKKTTVTEVWSASSGDHLKRIEEQIDELEKHLRQIIQRLKPETKNKSSTIQYTISGKQ